MTRAADPVAGARQPETDQASARVRPGRIRRMVVVAAVIVVAVIVAAGLAVWFSTGARPAPHPTVPVATAAVVRTSLATTTQLSATIGYSGSVTIVPQTSGTITALPSAGATVTRGEPLYEIDGAGVFLFYGSRPAWRTFELGMTPGPDVQQLEANLQALGFGADLTVDDDFTWYTENAILHWQQATGQEQTGTVTLGTIAFATGPLRIAAVDAPLGSPAEPGQSILSATSPDPVVTVDVPPSQAYLVHTGDRVTVTLPTGTTTPGTVTDVSTVAQSSTGDSSRGASSQSSAPPEVTVPADIRLDDPSKAAGFDQAPVTVNVTDRQVHDVLAVPITALVALANGGYAVWVDPSHGERRLTAVTPGLFADTLVQVTASGLRPGDRVEVPAS